MQASELQEINKMMKEADRLCAMADTASFAISDAEDWGSKDDDRQNRPAAAANQNCLAFAKTALYDDLANHKDLAIARAFLRHSVEFVLPPHCRSDVMHVIGVHTKKLTKTKAGLIVKFLTPQSLKIFTMQMYCTSLEPKCGLGQGADVLTLELE